jgi:hypothetical protein
MKSLNRKRLTQLGIDRATSLRNGRPDTEFVPLSPVRSTLKTGHRSLAWARPLGPQADSAPLARSSLPQKRTPACGHTAGMPLIASVGHLLSET